jgi:hypothetical protein
MLSFNQLDLDNEDIGMSPVLAPTRKEGPKQEPADGVPAKAAPAPKSTPPSAAPSKNKRKASATEDSKPAAGANLKRAKSEVCFATSTIYILLWLSMRIPFAVPVSSWL